MDGLNIFVTCRGDDTSVGPCEQIRDAACADDYARYLAKKIRHTGKGFSLYGGRMYEDLGSLEPGRAEELIEYRMFYTDVTVVLVSPEMVDRSIPEGMQWPARIVRRSLNGRRASRGEGSENPVVAVLLPGKDGGYGYSVFQDGELWGLRTECMFGIMQRNMFNRTDPPSKTRFRRYLDTCESCYIPVQTWDYFICNFVRTMAQALRVQGKESLYDISRDFAINEI